MNKIKKFLKSKYRTEYDRFDIVPWHKSLWYYSYPKNKNICTIIPLCILLIIIRNIWYVLKMFGNDSRIFYKNQLKIRKKTEDNCPLCSYSKRKQNLK